MNHRVDQGDIGRGEVLVLAQRSVRRRDYELRHGDQLLGWLRFPPGERWVAMACGNPTGSLALIAGSGGVEVRAGTGAAAVIATVERDRGGVAAIRPTGGTALGWRRTGWQRSRWAIDNGDVTLLRFAAAIGC
jgi:hypothetical protein